MSSSSGSVQQTAGSLIVSADLVVGGSISQANSSHPPQPAPGGGGAVVPPHLAPVDPPNNDKPQFPPVPFPAPIEALGGFVGPYFQAGHTTWTVDNLDYFPYCGPFWTPGLLQVCIVERRSNAAGTPDTGRGIAYQTYMLYWGDTSLPVAISPASTGQPLNTPGGGVGTYLPNSATDFNGVPITAASPIPSGSPRLLARLIKSDGSNLVFQGQGAADSTGFTTAQYGLPCYITGSISSQQAARASYDVNWTFTPSAGYTGQIVPIIPIPESYTKTTGSTAVADVPPNWAAGATYAPGYVVIAPQAPFASPAITTPTYWQATGQITNPSVAPGADGKGGNQPGTQGSLFPAVQWTIFGA